MKYHYRYLSVYTLGDGYHLGEPKVYDMVGFYKNLANAFEKLEFLGLHNTEEEPWFQFAFNDEDTGEGIAFYIERK